MFTSAYRRAYREREYGTLARDREFLHAALTERGQECELLVYGDEGHGLAQRANRSDATPKALAFLARHLAG